MEPTVIGTTSMLYLVTEELTNNPVLNRDGHPQLKRSPDMDAIEWVVFGFTVESMRPWRDAGCWIAGRTADLRDMGILPETAAKLHERSGSTLGAAYCNDDAIMLDFIRIEKNL